MKIKRFFNKKRLRKIGFFVLPLVCVFLGLFIGAIGSMYGSAHDLAENAVNMSMDLTTIVYAKNTENGEYEAVESLYADENRVWVDIEKIPQDLQDAFVAIEDERFFKHGGVDLKRTIGATVQYVFRGGESSYGGSTITQQLIKNITGEKDGSPKRKIKEMYRASVMESELSKIEILELYLNTIYLSQQCNGVQSAANLYFGKDVSALTLRESVCLAGITQLPTYYDPIQNPENNTNKSKVILEKMLDLKMITKEEYDAALAEDIVINPNYQEVRKNTQSYFADALIEEVLEDLQEIGYSKTYAKQLLYSGGLKIYSTLDQDVQRVMDKVYKDDSQFPAGRNGAQIESSMVVMDPYTGEIKGLVGGRGEKTGNRVLNRATQTTRQPGSTIKPIAVYAPAIEYGAADINGSVMDAPLNIDGWRPKNSYRGHRGLASIRSAVASSMNIPAVRVLQRIGVEQSFEFMSENLHVSTLIDLEERNGRVLSDKGLASLALGGLTDGMSVMEMTAAYAPFVNSGIYSTPHFYTKIVDREGKVLLEQNGTQSVAMREYTASAMTKLLQGVVNGGTGSRAKFSGMAIAGKTGTTSDNKDRWFVGYTPYYVSAVWVGFDEPKSLGYISGTNPALLLWRAVNEEIHKELETKAFEEYDGSNKKGNTVTRTVCSLSTKLAGSYCFNCAITETFLADAVPTSYCNVHSINNPGMMPSEEPQEGEITDSNEGQNADPNAPPDAITDPPSEEESAESILNVLTSEDNESIITDN